MPSIIEHPRRIVLVNPTRYLGNLLIAGGLIKAFADHCAAQGVEFRLVIDEAFAELFSGAFPGEQLMVYPRRRIAAAGNWEKLKLYLGCLRRIRAFHADIAFNIEEDSVSHRLTQLSGAHFKLGCSTQRHGRGYDKVLQINYAARPPERQHRWYSFWEVFEFLGLPAVQPGYLLLPVGDLWNTLGPRLAELGIDFDKPVAALHVGATKLYKKWPPDYFATLVAQLRDNGYQVAFIGAGRDSDDIAAVTDRLPANIAADTVNLCNRLSLRELAAFLQRVRLFVGNDSGPCHLAAAMGAKGVAIFGPTRIDLWGPLSARMTVLQEGGVCSPECTRSRCQFEHRCLTAITPDKVMNAAGLGAV